MDSTNFWRPATPHTRLATHVPKIFQPIRVGTANLQHRVVSAPMRRSRAADRYILGALGLEYYKQRTSVPGTLAITEGTFISGGYANIPGIWNDEQIAGWKSVRSRTFFFLYVFFPMITPDHGRGTRKRIVRLSPALGPRARRRRRPFPESGRLFGRRAERHRAERGGDLR